MRRSDMRLDIITAFLSFYCVVRSLMPHLAPPCLIVPAAAMQCQTWHVTGAAAVSARYDNQLLCLRHHVAAAAANLHAVDIDARLQLATVAARQVPVYGIVVVCRHAALLVLPQRTAAHVEHLNLHVKVASGAVVVDDKRCRRSGGVGRAVDVYQTGAQTADHVERKFGGGQVVHYVPCLKPERVHARLKLRYAVVCRATGVAAEVVAEVVVQHVCLVGIAVYGQHKVVAYAAARGVYSVFVGYLGHEIRRWIYVAAVDKGRRVKIAIDRRAYAVVVERACSAHDEVFAVAVHGIARVAVYCKHVYQSALVAVVDVLAHGKRHAELACPHAVGAVEQGV